MSRKCFGLLAIWISAAALAAPGLVIDRIHGDPGPLRNQLASELCKPMACLPLRSVETGKGLSWKAVEQKDGRVLVGSVTGGTRAHVGEPVALGPEGPRARPLELPAHRGAALAGRGGLADLGASDAARGEAALARHRRARSRAASPGAGGGVARPRSQSLRIRSR